MFTRLRLGLALSALVFLVGTVAVLEKVFFVDSASVTGAVEKLAVQNGVVTIVPGRLGDSVMEIGNDGRDIASSGSIFFRPNSSNAGSVFYAGAGNTQNFDLTGTLTVNGGISLNGILRTTWPLADYWVVDAGNNVTPSAASYGVDTPQGFDVFGNSPFGNNFSAVRISNPGNVAVDFYYPPGLTSSMMEEVTGDFTVTGGDIYQCGETAMRFYAWGSGTPPCITDPISWGKVWTAGNDGIGSGADADNLSGHDVYLNDNFLGFGAGIYGFCGVTENLGEDRCELMWFRDTIIP